MTLTEFLLARIAEDEALAKAVDGGWDVVSHVSPIDADPAWMKNGQADMIAYAVRHNPARVLAECEAKRRIVLSLGDLMRAYDALPDDTEGTDPIRFESVCGAANVAETVLRDLAGVDVDHPDYRAAIRSVSSLP